MQNEPEIFFQPHADPLTQTSQLNNLPAFCAVDWWYGGAQQKGRGNLHAFKRLTLNTLLQRFDIDNNVRQFRHRFSNLIY